MFMPVRLVVAFAFVFGVLLSLVSPTTAEDREFFLNRGLDYMKQKKYHEALADFDLVSGKPLPPSANSAIISAYMALGEYDNALGAFGIGSIVEGPNAASEYNLLAAILYGMKDYGKALDNCKEAVRRKPDFAVAINTCGASLEKLGRLREALQFYSEAIRLKPDLVNAWAGRGVSYARMGEIDNAASDCEHASQLNSQYSHNYFCRGLIAEAKGLVLPAAREFESALRIAPNNTQYLDAWSRVAKARVSHESRVALVIGNADYKNSPLNSPVRDADAVAGALQKVGFKVIRGTNVNRLVMMQLFEEFNPLARKSDVALVYFSGHGGEYKGVNYLVPADVDLADVSPFIFKYRPHAYEGAEQYLDLQNMTNQIRDVDRTRILIVDACRTSGGFQSWEQRGMIPGAFENSIDGMFAFFASSEDKTAQDGGLDISPFAKALVSNLTRKGVELRDMFQAVKTSTAKFSNNGEAPQSIDLLERKFYFYPPDVRYPLADAPP
jgi:tetratricopeptide (TPR) repeat protein